MCAAGKHCVRTGQIIVQADRFVSSQFLLSVGTRFTRSQLEAISGFYATRCSGVCVCMCVCEASAGVNGPGPEILMSPCIPKRGRREERGEAERVGGGRGEGRLPSSPFVAFPHLEVVQEAAIKRLLKY